MVLPLHHVSVCSSEMPYFSLIWIYSHARVTLTFVFVLFIVIFTIGSNASVVRVWFEVYKCISFCFYNAYILFIVYYLFWIFCWWLWKIRYTIITLFDSNYVAMSIMYWITFESIQCLQLISYLKSVWRLLGLQVSFSFNKVNGIYVKISKKILVVLEATMIVKIKVFHDRHYAILIRISRIKFLE